MKKFKVVYKDSVVIERRMTGVVVAETKEEAIKQVEKGEVLQQMMVKHQETHTPIFLEVLKVDAFQK